MPLYTIAVPFGRLDADAKASLAAGITDLHCDMAEVPRDWVHVVFNEYSPGCAFTAGEPAMTVALTVIIRTGRSLDHKRRMLERLGSVLKAGSDASDEEIVIGILEVPASQAMEMGQVMPDA